MKAKNEINQKKKIHSTTRVSNRLDNFIIISLTLTVLFSGFK